MNISELADMSIVINHIRAIVNTSRLPRETLLALRQQAAMLENKFVELVLADHEQKPRASTPLTTSVAAVNVSKTADMFTVEAPTDVSEDVQRDSSDDSKVSSSKSKRKKQTVTPASAEPAVEPVNIESTAAAISKRLMEEKRKLVTRTK